MTAPAKRSAREVARGLAEGHFCEPSSECGHYEDIEQALLTARAEAFEEAARIAARSDFVDCALGTIEGQIASAIRAAKDRKAGEES